MNEEQWDEHRVPTVLDFIVYFSRKYLYGERIVSVAALPGLMTLLDTALYRANEGCLTATVCAADSVLSAILEVKSLSKKLLKAVLMAEADVSEISSQKHKVAQSRGKRQNQHNHSGGSVSSDMNAFVERESAESFARLCLEYANNCIEKISCDRFARSANFDPRASDSSEPARNYKAYLHDNARNPRLKASDCWESPRLLCPDYIWADEALQYCLKSLRHLSKHRFLSSPDKHFDYETNQTNQYFNSSSPATSTEWMWPNLPLDCLQLADQLYNLIRVDLPSKLCQFRTAVESETTVSKRLYLVKCEYRAPFRAFLDSLNTLMKFPSPRLLDEVVKIYKSNSKTKTNANTTPSSDPQDPLPISDNLELKERLEQTTSGLADCLQNNHWLVKALKMEKYLEMFELSMSQSLAPFTDVARFLDSKKCRIVPYDTILEAKQVPALRELLYRLRSISGQDSTKVGPGDLPNFDAHQHNSSIGNNGGGVGLVDGARQIYSIRPILVDIQGIVPRDDSVIDPFGNVTEMIEMEVEEAMTIALARLNRFLSQLETLTNILQTKGALLFLDRKEYDIPSNLIQKCKKFDAELFEAKFKDWWLMIGLQHEHLRAQDLLDGEYKHSSQERVVEEFAKETIRWEMDFTLTASPFKTLSKIKQAFESCSTDASKKFEVLNAIIVDIANREMNLTIELRKPEALRTRVGPEPTEYNEEQLIREHCTHMTQGLELKETSCLGVFGHTLVGAGEILPIG